MKIVRLPKSRRSLRRFAPFSLSEKRGKPEYLILLIINRLTAGTRMTLILWMNAHCVTEKKMTLLPRAVAAMGAGIPV